MKLFKIPFVEWKIILKSFLQIISICDKQYSVAHSYCILQVCGAENLCEKKPCMRKIREVEFGHVCLLFSGKTVAYCDTNLQGRTIPYLHVWKILKLSFASPTFIMDIYSRDTLIYHADQLYTMFSVCFKALYLITKQTK